MHVRIYSCMHTQTHILWVLCEEVRGDTDVRKWEVTLMWGSERWHWCEEVRGDTDVRKWEVTLMWGSERRYRPAYYATRYEAYTVFLHHTYRALDTTRRCSCMHVCMYNMIMHVWPFVTAVASRVPHPVCVCVCLCVLLSISDSLEHRWTPWILLVCMYQQIWYPSWTHASLRH